MGNRRRRRRHVDGTISDARAQAPVGDPGTTNDPLFGIPDTNMPGLAGIRMARALQGRRGWRRGYAVVWLVCSVLSAVSIWLVLLIR